MLAEHGSERHGHAALARPDSLHLAGEGRRGELHIVEEVILRAGLGAGTIDYKVAHRSFAKNRPFAGKLRTGHVSDCATAQIEGINNLGVFAGLILPEQRRVAEVELSLDPVLYFMCVDVHCPTS